MITRPIDCERYIAIRDDGDGGESPDWQTVASTRFGASERADWNELHDNPGMENFWKLHRVRRIALVQITELEAS